MVRRKFRIEYAITMQRGRVITGSFERKSFGNVADVLNEELRAGLPVTRIREIGKPRRMP
jgi:hypothetical protein